MSTCTSGTPAPTAEELGTGRLAPATHSARRLEHDVIGEDLGEAVDVVGVEVSVPRSNASWMVVMGAPPSDLWACHARIG